MIATLLLSAFALAGQLIVEADAPRLSVGETIGLYVSFVDVRPDAPPDLEIPGARLAYRGPKQSFVSVNGKNTLTVTYLYALTAEREGELVVPALSAAAGGETLRSRELRLQVSPRAEITGDSALSASIGAETIWVGQTLVYQFDFRTRLRVMDRRWTPPTWTGFVPEQTAEADVREYDASRDGEPWRVVQIAQPLVATTPGPQSIPSAVITVQVPDRTTTSQSPFGRMGFANTRSEVFAAQPIAIDVKPLPDEGRSGAWSGLIGRFTLDASLSAPSVKVGDSVTLTLTLEGDGTLSGWKLPEPPQGVGWRAYDTDPEVRGEVSGGAFRSRGVFKRAIVPEAAGALTLDPIALQVFDPVEGRYVDLSTPALTLQVLPGEQSGSVSSFAGPSDARQDVAALGEDILPVHTRAGDGAQRVRPLAALGVALTPWLALLGLTLSGARARLAPATDPRKELLKQSESVGDSPDALEALFREALGLHLGVPAASLERERLAGQLSGALRDEVLGLYAALEAARYGAGGGDLRERVRACVARLLEVRR